MSQTFIGQVVAGALFADLLVALLHWFEDTYLPYTTGTGLVDDIARDNELHHFVPFAITTVSPWENVSVSLPLSLMITGVLVAIFPGWSRNHVPFLVTMTCVGAISNLIHRYAHERLCRRPRIIKTLQDAGVLVSSEEHARHHRVPTERYGVVFGFTNVVYDSIGLWRFLETLVPLKKHPKPGMGAYKKLHDGWTIANMSKECPDPIPPNRVRGYRQILLARHGSERK